MIISQITPEKLPNNRRNSAETVSARSIYKHWGDFNSVICSDKESKKPEQKITPSKPKHARITSAQSSSKKNYENSDQSPQINLEIPRLSYNTFRSRPRNSEDSRQLFVKNTFFVSPRSKIQIFSREEINIKPIPMFKTIPMKKFTKRTMEKIWFNKESNETINTKIKKIHKILIEEDN